MPTAAAAGISRWNVATRVFAALIPAFILTNTLSVFLGLLWPGAKVNGVAWGTLLSYAFYTCIIMWIFSVKRLRTVWLGLLAGLVVTGGGAWLLYFLENRP